MLNLIHDLIEWTLIGTWRPTASYQVCSEREDLTLFFPPGIQ